MTALADAVDLARQIRAGVRSPREAVDDAIGRVERLDRELNAVIHPRFERAVTEASAGVPEGPFHGVPLLV